MSKKAEQMQKRITELENKEGRGKKETGELRSLVTNYPSNTDLYIEDKTLDEIYPH